MICFVRPSEHRDIIVKYDSGNISIAEEIIERPFTISRFIDELILKANLDYLTECIPIVREVEEIANNYYKDNLNNNLSLTSKMPYTKLKELSKKQQELLIRLILRKMTPVNCTDKIQVFESREKYDEFINILFKIQRLSEECEDKKTINLPVPLGTTVYRFVTSCNDACLFQKEAFDKVFPVIDGGRCNKNLPCHTKLHSIDSIILTLSNLDLVLNNWGFDIFETEEEAKSKGEEFIKLHHKELVELGLLV